MSDVRTGNFAFGEIEPDMSMAENTGYVGALNDAVPHALDRQSSKRFQMNPISRAVVAALVLGASANIAAAQTAEGPRWLAGDHHIHSRFSVDLDESTSPPTPIIGGEPYPTPMNALMARHFGLDWMVTTDHGDPNHSKINLEHAYPELLQSREVVPDLVQFYGMELDTPGADHSSLIIPHSDHEHHMLYDLESKYSKHDAWPRDSTRYTEERMIEALTYMKGLMLLPVVIANHPSRSATGLGVYGQDRPAELRNWNDTAPRVAVGWRGHPATRRTRFTVTDPSTQKAGEEATMITRRWAASIR